MKKNIGIEIYLQHLRLKSNNIQQGVLMRSLFPEKYHRSIYIFALIMLVVGLSLSKFLMSLSQIILACNWLLEGNVKNKFIAFWKNKPALVASSLLLLHIIGLIYTSDFNYAFKDIRIKSPLFILPLIISTSKPLSKKLFDIILQFFVAAIIVGTIVSTLIFVGVIYHPIVDIRGISIFISHISFALLICVAVFVSGYFIYYSLNTFSKIIWSVIMIWLIVFLALLGSLTGLIVLPLTVLILAIYMLLTSNKYVIKYVGSILLFGSITLLVYKVNSIAKESNKKEIVDFSKLDKFTSHGNLYEQDTITKAFENGHLIWINYCPKELEESWNKRSRITIGNDDLKGNDIYNRLIRFLASKGMKKDADAVSLLTNDEVKAIEHGAANVNYQNVNSLKGRIYETLWEIDIYKASGDANGHSLTQRFEYWKTALSIIKENPIFGVGTGDVPTAFDQEYVKLNSSLAKEWRLRAHNQYLSIGVAFGIVGLLWFLITLIYPMLKEKNGFNYLYITFFIITIISFFSDDTLETQAGATYFAFLNSYFLFAQEKDA